jgi:predicted nucleotidyltransferase component of viral defense system
LIDRGEILAVATDLGLSPEIVEKDYVLGWLLKGIYSHPSLSSAFIFKGGTCLKKCYFETYRFSEDLDFTLNDSAPLDAEFLKRVFSEGTNCTKTSACKFLRSSSDLMSTAILEVA